MSGYEQKGKGFFGGLLVRLICNLEGNPGALSQLAAAEPKNWRKNALRGVYLHTLGGSFRLLYCAEEMRILRALTGRDRLAEIHAWTFSSNST